MISRQGLNYLGTIDDAAQRFPWKFAITAKYLEHSLIKQLLDGKPILLNDGYLVHHPLAQKAVTNRNSLLWALINKGFVRVLARGQGRYGLSEMPIQMKDSVSSFKNLINDKDLWPELKKNLEILDVVLSGDKSCIKWPSYDSGAGFRELARGIKNSSPHSLGLGKSVRNRAFASFIDECVDHMDRTTEGTRTYWEKTAFTYACNSKNTNDPNRFVNSLMNLANEMYHYNFGLMLAGEHKAQISVETQTSAAFDDLLIRPGILLTDIPRLPNLTIPFSLTDVRPETLVEILEPESNVGLARSWWIDSKLQMESASPLEKNRDDLFRNANEAAKNYSKELAKHFKKEIKFKETEGIIKYSISDNIKRLSEAAAVVGSSYAGQTFGLSPIEAAFAGFVSGYGISKLNKAASETVAEKYRIYLFEKQILPPKLIRNSLKFAAKIKQRRMPSTLLIDRSFASAHCAKLPMFTT